MVIQEESGLGEWEWSHWFAWYLICLMEWQSSSLFLSFMMYQVSVFIIFMALSWASVAWVVSIREFIIFICSLADRWWKLGILRDLIITVFRGSGNFSFIRGRFMANHAWACLVQVSMDTDLLFSVNHLSVLWFWFISLADLMIVWMW